MLILVTGGAIALLFLILAVFCARGARLALIIGPTGVTIRGLLHTTRIPWENVERIDSAPGSYWRRATRVRRTDGQFFTAIVTAYQYVLFRGEPYDEISRSPSIPLRPTQAAITAHQDWLRT